MLDLISSCEASFLYFGGSVFLFSILVWFLPHCFKLGVMTMVVADIALAMGIAFPRKMTEFLLEQGFPPAAFPDSQQAMIYGVGAGIGFFALCFALYYGLYLRKLKQRLSHPTVNYDKNSPQAKYQSPRSDSKSHEQQNKASFKASKDNAPLPLGGNEESDEKRIGHGLNNLTDKTNQNAGGSGKGINLVVGDDEEVAPTKKFLKQKTRSQRSRARSLHLNEESNLTNLEGNPLYAGVKDDSEQDVRLSPVNAQVEAKEEIKNNPLDGVVADLELAHGSAVLTNEALSKIILNKPENLPAANVTVNAANPATANRPDDHADGTLAGSTTQAALESLDKSHDAHEKSKIEGHEETAAASAEAVNGTLAYNKANAQKLSKILEYTSNDNASNLDDNGEGVPANTQVANAPYNTHGDSIEVEMLTGSKVGDVLSAMKDGNLPLSSIKPKVDLVADESSSFSFADMLDSAKKYQNHTSGDDTGILVDVTDDIAHNQALSYQNLGLHTTQSWDAAGNSPNQEFVQNSDYNSHQNSGLEQAIDQDLEHNQSLSQAQSQEFDSALAQSLSQNHPQTGDELAAHAAGHESVSDFSSNSSPDSSSDSITDSASAKDEMGHDALEHEYDEGLNEEPILVKRNQHLTMDEALSHLEQVESDLAQSESALEQAQEETSLALQSQKESQASAEQEPSTVNTAPVITLAPDFDDPTASHADEEFDMDVAPSVEITTEDSDLEWNDEPVQYEEATSLAEAVKSAQSSAAHSKDYTYAQPYEDYAPHLDDAENVGDKQADDGLEAKKSPYAGFAVEHHSFDELAHSMPELLESTEIVEPETLDLPQDVLDAPLKASEQSFEAAADKADKAVGQALNEQTHAALQHDYHAINSLVNDLSQGGQPNAHGQTQAQDHDISTHDTQAIVDAIKSGMSFGFTTSPNNPDVFQVSATQSSYTTRYSATLNEANLSGLFTGNSLGNAIAQELNDNYFAQEADQARPQEPQPSALSQQTQAAQQTQQIQPIEHEVPEHKLHEEPKCHVQAQQEQNTQQILQIQTDTSAEPEQQANADSVTSAETSVPDLAKVEAKTKTKTEDQIALPVAAHPNVEPSTEPVIEQAAEQALAQTETIVPGVQDQTSVKATTPNAVSDESLAQPQEQSQAKEPGIEPNIPAATAESAPSAQNVSDLTSELGNTPAQVSEQAAKSALTTAPSTTLEDAATQVESKQEFIVAPSKLPESLLEPKLMEAQTSSLSQADMDLAADIIPTIPVAPLPESVLNTPFTPLAHSLADDITPSIPVGDLSSGFELDLDHNSASTFIPAALAELNSKQPEPAVAQEQIEPTKAPAEATQSTQSAQSAQPKEVAAPVEQVNSVESTLEPASLASAELVGPKAAALQQAQSNPAITANTAQAVETNTAKPESVANTAITANATKPEISATASMPATHKIQAQTKPEFEVESEAGNEVKVDLESQPQVKSATQEAVKSQEQEPKAAFADTSAKSQLAEQTQTQVAPVLSSAHDVKSASAQASSVEPVQAQTPNTEKDLAQAIKLVAVEPSVSSAVAAPVVAPTLASEHPSPVVQAVPAAKRAQPAESAVAPKDLEPASEKIHTSVPETALGKARSEIAEPIIPGGKPKVVEESRTHLAGKRNVLRRPRPNVANAQQAHAQHQTQVQGAESLRAQPVSAKTNANIKPQANVHAKPNAHLAQAHPNTAPQTGATPATTNALAATTHGLAPATYVAPAAFQAQTNTNTNAPANGSQVARAANAATATKTVNAADTANINHAPAAHTHTTKSTTANTSQDLGNVAQGNAVQTRVQGIPQAKANAAHAIHIVQATNVANAQPALSSQGAQTAQTAQTAQANGTHTPNAPANGAMANVEAKAAQVAPAFNEQEKKAGRPSLKSHFAQILGKNPTGGLAARNVSALLNANRPQAGGPFIPKTVPGQNPVAEENRHNATEKQHSLKRISRLSEEEQAQRASSRLGSKIENAPARALSQSSNAQAQAKAQTVSQAPNQTAALTAATSAQTKLQVSGKSARIGGTDLAQENTALRASLAKGKTRSAVKSAASSQISSALAANNNANDQAQAQAQTKTKPQSQALSQSKSQPSQTQTQTQPKPKASAQTKSATSAPQAKSTVALAPATPSTKAQKVPASAPSVDTSKSNAMAKVNAANSKEVNSAKSSAPAQAQPNPALAQTAKTKTKTQKTAASTKAQPATHIAATAKSQSVNVPAASTDKPTAYKTANTAITAKPAHTANAPQATKAINSAHIAHAANAVNANAGKVASRPMMRKAANPALAVRNHSNVAPAHTQAPSQGHMQNNSEAAEQQQEAEGVTSLEHP